MATKNKFSVILPGQANTYQGVADAVRELHNDPFQRKIAIASLHGGRGRRTQSPPPEGSELAKAFAEFDQALRGAVESWDEPWEFRQVFNITTHERLDMLLVRAIDLDGPCYEVRAYMAPDTIPSFSPLVIGSKIAFLAQDDQRFYRAGSSMRADEPAVVQWVLSQFEVIWQGAPFILRDRSGVDQDEIARLRNAIDLSNQVAQSSKGRALTAELTTEVEPGRQIVDDLLNVIREGESATVEFKQSLEAVDETHPDIVKVPEVQRPNKIAESRRGVLHSALKTICAFCNAGGGSLFLGVHDSGEIVGLDPDYALCGKKPNRDGFELKLNALIKSRLSPLPTKYRTHFFLIDGKEICRITVPKTEPTYLDNELYIRFGNSTEKLVGREHEDWLKQRV